MATSRCCGRSVVTSRSPIRIRPALTSSSPAIIRSTVDLPQPDGPTSATNSPGRTDSDTSLTASTPPLNRLVTLTSWTPEGSWVAAATVAPGAVVTAGGSGGAGHGTPLAGAV